MQSTFSQESAARRATGLPKLPPVIVGAEEITHENGKTIARFSGNNMEDESCYAFFEDRHAVAADLKLIFSAGSKRLFFLRAERIVTAAITCEIIVEENAEITFVFLMKEPPTGEAGLDIRVEVQNGGNFILAGTHAGEGEFRLEISAEMQSENAVSSLAAIDVLKGNARSDISIENIAAAPHCQGVILVRNILFGKASSRVEGNPVIKQAARDSANHLDHSGLLLSSDAKLRAYPLLSVANNAVTASHKSATARLTPEDRFYLNSRGLSGNDADKLLLDGFLSEVLAEVNSDSIRNCTSETVHHFLEDEQ